MTNPLTRKFIDSLDPARRGIILAIAEMEYARTLLKTEDLMKRIINSAVNNDVNHSTVGMIDTMESFLEEKPNSSFDEILRKFIELQQG